jgi:hypothetical protein
LGNIVIVFPCNQIEVRQQVEMNRVRTPFEYWQQLIEEHVPVYNRCLYSVVQEEAFEGGQPSGGRVDPGRRQSVEYHLYHTNTSFYFPATMFRGRVYCIDGNHCS